MKSTTAFLPGQVTVTWRGGHVVSVELGSASRVPRNKKLLGRKLLLALDKGPRAAGFHIELADVPEFTRRALRACAKIPRGQVRTYRELAVALGRPEAARAVGTAMAKNPVPILIPCHRVVGSGGLLAGYTGGREWKEFLLAREGWSFSGQGNRRKVVGFRRT